MKKTESMWIIVGTRIKNQPYFVNSSLSYTRKECISQFIYGSTMDWNETKKHGWSVAKVSVTIETLTTT